MNTVLGIDLGTSFFKVGLVDKAGRFTGFSRIPVTPMKEPLGAGHRFELSVEDFIGSLRQGIAECLMQSGSSPANIDGISYSSQANSFLLLNEKVEPLTEIILWPDNRNGIDPAVHELWNGPRFLETTGTGVRGEISAVNKIRWLRKNQPEIWNRTRYLMTISDYLTFLLTGKRVGDRGTASLLGLYDLQNGQWWDDALGHLEIPQEYLSTPILPGYFAGETTDKSADLFGVSAGTPVFAGSLDHHVAALGAGAGSLAPLCDSTGTVLACLAPADRYEPKVEQCVLPNIGTVGYSRIAFTENSAGVLAWYQREYAPGMTIEALVKEAEQVPTGCGGLAACPYADTYSGLSGFSVPPGLNFTRGHFVRAIMESVAESLQVLAWSLLGSGEAIPPMAATGGGAKSDLWLQIKADLLNTTMTRTAVDEPACYGAAMIAAAGCGWFPSILEAAASWVKPEKIFTVS